MADLLAILGAARLGPIAAGRLVGWKAWHRALHRYERATGYGRRTAVGEQFGRDWLETYGAGGVTSWLARRQAGCFHIDPATAPEWCRATHTPDDLELADTAVQGVFDLLGSGPRSLGDPPQWRTDLYSGQLWPLEDSGTLQFVRGDGSDIRTVWELSRGYHFIALARSYWSTGSEQYARTFERHITSWIEQNPLGYGPHWASPMDAALRGANWTLAAILFAQAEVLDRTFWAHVLANLYATAWHVERHREWHPIFRGNHYVANGLGLAYLGTLFRGDRRGERWLRMGSRILTDELLRQVHVDGVSFEASLGYHRLATQLFAYGAEIVRRNAPGRWTAMHQQRLGAMYRFIDAYMPVTGLAPMLGDADDEHVFLEEARMLHEPRRHRLGLPPLSEQPVAAASESRLFAAGGFAVLCAGDDHCIVRCGPVGLLGAGSHDHNDQLSYELVIGGRRIVRDSGTYCYTRDLEERFRFRSTAAHNAVQLGGEEQNPILVDKPWRVLRDRTRARITEWLDDEDEIRFRGEHRGYTYRSGSPVVHREIRHSRLDGSWTITDVVMPAAGQSVPDRLDWYLHLDGAAEMLDTTPVSARIRIGGVTIQIDYPEELYFTLAETDSSTRYGVLQKRPVLRLDGIAVLPTRIVTRFTLAS